MVLETESPAKMTRLTAYVEELQAVLRQHKVPCGQPAELRAATQSLQGQGALVDEMSAAVRSIVYREHETVTEADLIDLLAAAMGGPAADARSPAFQATEDTLRAFLGGALRSFWRSSPDAPYRSRLAGKAPKPQPAVQPGPMPLAADWGPPESAVGKIAARVSSAEQSRSGATTGALKNDPLESDENVFRNQEAVAAEVARLLARDGGRRQPASYIEEVHVVDGTEHGASFPPRDPEPTRPAVRPTHLRPALKPAVSPAQAVPSPARASASTPVQPPAPRLSATSARIAQLPEAAPEAEEDDGTFPEYSPLPWFRPEYRLLWIVGVGCLVLGLILGFLLRNHSNSGAVASPDYVPAKISSLPAPKSLPKPSPYTLPSPPAASSPAETTSPRQSARLASRDSLAPGTTSGNAPGTIQTVPQLPVRVAARTAALTPSARASAEPVEAYPLSQPSGPLSLTPGKAATDAPPKNAVYLSASGVMAGNLLAAPSPVYPAVASRSGVQGKVVVEALIGRDGHVLGAHVVSGDTLLREAALEAVERWRYRPYVANGRAAEVETTATLDFRLFQ